MTLPSPLPRPGALSSCCSPGADADADADDDADADASPPASAALSSTAKALELQLVEHGEAEGLVPQLGGRLRIAEYAQYAGEGPQELRRPSDIRTRSPRWTANTEAVRDHCRHAVEVQQRVAGAARRRPSAARPAPRRRSCIYEVLAQARQPLRERRHVVGHHEDLPDGLVRNAVQQRLGDRRPRHARVTGVKQKSVSTCASGTAARPRPRPRPPAAAHDGVQLVAHGGPQGSGGG